MTIQYPMRQSNEYRSVRNDEISTLIDSFSANNHEGTRQSIVLLDLRTQNPVLRVVSLESSSSRGIYEISMLRQGKDHNKTSIIQTGFTYHNPELILAYE